MTASTVGRRSAGAEKSPDERRSPREVLIALEDQMKRKVKRFDLRVLGNKRKLEKIRGHLNRYLDECEKSFERRLDEFEARVDGLTGRVETYEKKLAFSPMNREQKDE